MLEIVLFILKTAGIILVVVLGILIAAAFSVLFVPARYRGSFSVPDMGEDGKKAISVKFRAVWFLRLVRVYITCEGKFGVKVKVLFFTLVDTAREQSGKSEKKRKKKKKRKEENGSFKEERQSAVQTGEAVCPEMNEKEETLRKNGGGTETEDTKEKKREGNGKKTGKFQFSNILQTIRNFCDKLRGIKEKAERIETLWVSEHAVNSRSLIGRQLLYLFRHTKPKNLSGYLRFGFDDPSTTGYAMAVYGILYPVWSPKLSLEPDFEKQVFDCHILVKGKIRAWHFAKAALAVFLSKDVRRVIKDVRDF